MGEAESRAFFLLDMMIGLLGGEIGSRDGVARQVVGGLPRASIALQGVPRALVRVPKEMVDLEGVPSSFRGVPRRPAVGL